MTPDVVPGPVDVAEAQLTDLRERLRRTRWPEPEPVDDWSQGIPLAYVQELCHHWAEAYDWRRAEARLNAAGPVRTEIDGLGIHALHVRSPHPAALPLVMTHGWPGSVVEFLGVIAPLTDPTAHGGDAEDAFHLVCPSLPGYGFSDKPTRPGWGSARIAAAWAQLMARLGYDRYGAQGGDWGAVVSAALAAVDPGHLTGMHLTMPMVSPAALEHFGELTEAEQAGVARMRHYRRRESGYALQQATRPQTLGYGLVDSPAAQCAWIVEKFRAWSDCDGHPENVIPRDDLLDNVMLYWLPGTGASSARLYWESHGVIPEEPIDVPTACTIFPQELFRFSPRWLRHRFRDLRYFSEPERGGHFAALEQPELFVAEVRAAFRALR